MISALIFIDGRVSRTTNNEDIVKAYQQGSVWIDIQKPSQEDIDFLEKTFGFDKLLLDDIKNPVLRPKIDEYENHVFIVLHTIKLLDKRYRRRELDFVLGKNFIITSHYEGFPNMEAVQQKCEKDHSLLSQNLDILMFHIVNVLVDSYFPIIDKLNEEISDFEKTSLIGQSKEQLQRIADLQKNVVDLRRIIGPERETINLLTKETYRQIRKNALPYFKDVYDRIYRVSESVDASREILASSAQVYFSLLSMKLNKTIELLTVIFTMTLPPTIIASLYGMNVKLPYEQSDGAFLGIFIASFGVSVLLALFFRKKGWF